MAYVGLTTRLRRHSVAVTQRRNGHMQGYVLAMEDK